MFDIGAFPIFECAPCVHRATPPPPNTASHVEEIYSDEYFLSGGAGYPNYIEEKDVLTQRGRYYGTLLVRHIPRPGAVLDIGAASGFTLQAFRSLGWQTCGVEPNVRMAEYAREQLGLDVRNGTVESFDTAMKYDLLILLQVIAHLPNPRMALRHACRFLHPEGFILIETWDYRSVTARLQGRRWHEYSLPSVLHWFSKKSLHALMNQLNCKLIATGHPKKQIHLAHAASVLEHKYGHMPPFRLVLRALRVLPHGSSIPYHFGDVFWALYRREPASTSC